ncbi:MAG: T9SS type A sorting domain-containing protein [Candidatus Sabulitectum sp.]|nr:T9SS type A sorting domain-containing protein [Candidatus Sabulitectum sp.]
MITFRSGFLISFVLALLIVPAANGGLFAGLQGGAPPTYFSELDSFPDVTWTQYYNFDVLGAAATPEDTLYLCSSEFNTDLYKATLSMSPEFIAEISESMQSLAFGRDTLWGFSNFASVKGIYSINTQTGQATFEIDTYTGTSYRFFALGYNPVDDMLYGYTEYGTSGLYSIDIDTGDMVQIVGTIPASNGQGRGLAVGNNTVYLTATRGDDAIPYFAYDLSQGTNGEWVEFTNPYPAYHSTGGAAWLSESAGIDDQNSATEDENLLQFSISPNPVMSHASFNYQLPLAGNASLTVYDTSGRIQSSVMNGAFETGSGEVSWNSDLPSGIYIAVLRAGNQTVSRVFVLMK